MTLALKNWDDDFKPSICLCSLHDPPLPFRLRILNSDEVDRTMLDRTVYLAMSTEVAGTLGWVGGH